MTGLISFASLVTCEGGVNALSRKGCGHFEAFDQSNEGFEHKIFLVEDPVLKRLFPDPYPHDSTASSEFRRFTERDLKAKKVGVSAPGMTTISD